MLDYKRDDDNHFTLLQHPDDDEELPWSVVDDEDSLQEKITAHRPWLFRGTLALGSLLLVTCGFFAGRQSINKMDNDSQRTDLPPHVHGSYDLRYHSGILPSTTRSRLFGNVTTSSIDKITVPEFVDPDLLAVVDGIHNGYAKTMRVPQQSRNKLITQFSAEFAVAVLIGENLAFREGADTELRFRQESNFHYLTGFDHPDAKLILGLDPNDDLLPAGSVWLFVEPGNAVWQGRTETLQDFKDMYDIDDAFWMQDFDSKLESLYVSQLTVYTFSDVDIKIPDGVVHDTYTLRGKFSLARRIKTDVEIEALRAAAEVGVQSHIVVMQNVRCGNYESDAESLFRYVGHNYGMKFQAYIPIVGSGGNSAALHYNDNQQKIPDDSLVLIDAGPEIGSTRNGGGYGTDITRTWPCTGAWTTPQRAIYDIVADAQAKCVEMCIPGSSMSEASSKANDIILQGLLNVGILQDADVERLRSLNMHRVFMPHGLGHSVGIDVHDPGSITPFAPGMVVTCEPGIYFIKSLIDSAYNNPNQGPLLNKELIESTFIGMGGFRIEDTVLITESGPDNLSGELAHTSTEVEQLMKSGKKIHDNAANTAKKIVSN